MKRHFICEQAEIRRYNIGIQGPLSEFPSEPNVFMGIDKEDQFKSLPFITPRDSTTKKR